MKRIYFCFLLVLLNVITMVSLGQNRSMPGGLADVFAKMYPDAKDVEWRDKMDDILVFFKIRDARCEAKFTKDGSWISTEETMSWDSLPMAIKDSAKLGRYADWKQTACYVLRFPAQAVQYHIVVTRADLGRKILFFDKSGRLLTEH